MDPEIFARGIQAQCYDNVFLVPISYFEEGWGVSLHIPREIKISRERGAEGGPNAYSYGNLKHLNFRGWGGGWGNGGILGIII